jgi:ribosomal protein L13
LAKQINAEKVAVSGQKRSQKLYRRHSGRPGGMKVETFDQLQKRIPERIVEHAVRGMLPKGRVCSHSLILSLFFSLILLRENKIEHAFNKTRRREDRSE